MAKSPPDRATAAGTLETRFDLEYNSKNQGIAERAKILKITNHRLKSLPLLLHWSTIPAFDFSTVDPEIWCKYI